MNISTVKAISGNSYEFHINDEMTGPFQVELLNTENVLGEFDRNHFIIENIKTEERPFFRISNKNIEFTLAERTLPVDGMNNFRDMGGYKSKDGRRVKWGMLYRSDHLWNATENGVKYLRKLGLKTIIDYRSDDEIEKYPNAFLSEDVETYVLDPNAHAAELSAQFSSSKQDEDKNLIKKIKEQQERGVLKSQYDIILKQYRNFVYHDESKEVFAKMLKVAAQENTEPLLQHCRGGKDRTGFGVLLILGALGVSSDQIIYDYMLTEENRVERNRVKMEGYKKLTQDPEILDYLYSLIDTREDFIKTSIEEIETEFGSIEQYITASEGLNLPETVIERLREKFLEE